MKIRKEKVGGQQQQSEKKENKSRVDLKTNLLFFFSFCLSICGSAENLFNKE